MKQIALGGYRLADAIAAIYAWFWLGLINAILIKW